MAVTDRNPPPAAAGPAPLPARDPETAGLARALAVGGALGFAAVFAIVTLGLWLTATTGLPTALAGGAFVGAFGGLGFGAMMGGSLHRPPAGGPE